MDSVRASHLRKPLVVIVSENVKRRVKKLGGQIKFAERAGVSQSTVSRVTNIGQDVTLGLLESLAKGCDCEPYQLLIDSERMRQAFEVVERFLPPQSPAPEATAPKELPASRVGKGAGEKAVDETALRPEGKQEHLPTARVEKVPGRRKGPGRVRGKRQ